MIVKGPGIELISAIAEDVTSAMTGLPVSTLKKLGEISIPNWMKADYYVKWNEVLFFPAFYKNLKLLKFPYKKKSYILPQIIEIENKDNGISLDDIFINPDNEKFELDPSVIGLTDKCFANYRRYLLIKRKKYHEGRLARLKKITIENNTISLNVQPVSYQSVCRTNLCLDAKETIESKSLREVVHKSGKIEKLEDSPMGNALGINFLLFTADGRLVAPYRSKKVVVRASQLSPTSSGDFEFSDVYGDKRSISTVQLFRESIEELYISNEHITDNEITFLGVTRELVRGGKPEMFFMAKTILTQKEFLNKHPLAKDKWEFEKKGKGWVFWPFDENLFSDTISETDKYNIQTDFDKFLDSHGSKISVPLLTGLILFLRLRLHNAFCI